MKNSNWFKKAIIYQIFIDRFAGYKNTDWQKPKFLGGNLNGIKKKIPYLKELGINTVWLSPFCKTNAYHGYHVTDFFKVEPSFGTLKDLKDLIKEFHKNKIRIIADFTANHVSYKHPFFLDAKKNKNSKYKNWFIFKKWPKNYMCFLSYKELAKLNLDNPDTRAHVVKAAKFWLKLGIDGYRLDHVAGPKHNFWKYFAKEIKKDFPNKVLIGEAFVGGVNLHELNTLGIKRKLINSLFANSSDDLQSQYIHELDGVLDFRASYLIRKYIAKKNIFRPRWLLKKRLKNHYKKYPKKYYLPTFLDNHDTQRFMFECKNNVKKLKSAARIQFSIPQPIVIYYGTEQGMSHKKPFKALKSHADLLARQPMPWNNQNKELFNFYKDLIKDRTHM